MIDVLMPRWGLTMEEGTVTRWLKREGEPVTAGEPLLEVETDKSVGEVESPGAGVLGERLADEGDVRPVGSVIARLYDEAEWAQRAQKGTR